jgi:DMSO/TMAO reductase YedYZ molybdopterin-dependent catalytic subunit
VAEAAWTGASLTAALELVGIPLDAREVILEGADEGPLEALAGSGSAEGVQRFARSLPLSKAFDDDVLLAYEMNGQPIPHEHGGPVRAVVPGWYATDSVKWLERIWFTNDEFAGFFQAQDYRFRLPGEPGLGHRMSALPVHSLITTPADGETGLRADLSIRGAAWGGTGGISQVLLSVDRGPWTAARLGPSRGPYARVSWESRLDLASGGHEVACRAVDGAGCTQPDHPPANLGGYANNAVHRISFEVA